MSSKRKQVGFSQLKYQGTTIILDEIAEIPPEHTNKGNNTVIILRLLNKHTTRTPESQSEACYNHIGEKRPKGYNQAKITYRALLKQYQRGIDENMKKQLELFKEDK